MSKRREWSEALLAFSVCAWLVVTFLSLTVWAEPPTDETAEEESGR